MNLTFNNIVTFVKKNILIILIIIIILILLLLLSIYISPYFLFLILISIPYLYVKNNRYGEIFKLLRKYKIKISKKKIPDDDNKYGENEESENDKIVPYIKEIIKDTEITENDTRFLLEVAKIEIKSEQDNEFDDKKYNKIIEQIANDESSNTLIRETFIKNYTNSEFDVYQLSDNIKTQIKNYQLDAEIMDKFNEDIKEDIYYLKDLLQVIDDINNLGTTNKEDKVVLNELQELSKNKKYIMKIEKIENILKDFSPELYHYISEPESSIFKLYKKSVSSHGVKTFVNKVNTLSLQQINELSSADKKIYDRRYEPCIKAYQYDIKSFENKQIEITKIPGRIAITDNSELISVIIEECFNSRSPSNYKFFHTLWIFASGFVSGTEEKKEGYKYYTKPKNDEYNMPNFDNKETPKTPETPNPTTFILNKSDYNKIILKSAIDEKTCPVYNILNQKLDNDTKSCKTNILKISPDKNLGCQELATKVFQDYTKSDKCPFGTSK